MPSSWPKGETFAVQLLGLLSQEAGVPVQQKMNMMSGGCVRLEARIVGTSAVACIRSAARSQHEQKLFSTLVVGCRIVAGGLHQ